MSVIGNIASPCSVRTFRKLGLIKWRLYTNLCSRLAFTIQHSVFHSLFHVFYSNPTGFLFCWQLTKILFIQLCNGYSSNGLFHALYNHFRKKDVNISVTVVCRFFNIYLYSSKKHNFFLTWLVRVKCSSHYKCSYTFSHYKHITLNIHTFSLANKCNVFKFNLITIQLSAWL